MRFPIHWAAVAVLAAGVAGVLVVAGDEAFAQSPASPNGAGNNPGDYYANIITNFHNVIHRGSSGIGNVQENRNQVYLDFSGSGTFESHGFEIVSGGLEGPDGIITLTQNAITVRSIDPTGTSASGRFYVVGGGDSTFTFIGRALACSTASPATCNAPVATALTATIADADANLRDGVDDSGSRVTINLAGSVSDSDTGSSINRSILTFRDGGTLESNSLRIVSGASASNGGTTLTVTGSTSPVLESTLAQARTITMDWRVFDNLNLFDDSTVTINVQNPGARTVSDISEALSVSTGTSGTFTINYLSHRTFSPVLEITNAADGSAPGIRCSQSCATNLGTGGHSMWDLEPAGNMANFSADAGTRELTGTLTTTSSGNIGQGRVTIIVAPELQARPFTDATVGATEFTVDFDDGIASPSSDISYTIDESIAYLEGDHDGSNNNRLQVVSGASVNADGTIDVTGSGNVVTFRSQSSTPRSIEIPYTAENIRGESSSTLTVNILGNRATQTVGNVGQFTVDLSSLASGSDTVTLTFPLTDFDRAVDKALAQSLAYLPADSQEIYEDLRDDYTPRNLNTTTHEIEWVSGGAEDPPRTITVSDPWIITFNNLSPKDRTVVANYTINGATYDTFPTATLDFDTPTDAIAINDALYAIVSPAAITVDAIGLINQSGTAYRDAVPTFTFLGEPSEHRFTSTAGTGDTSRSFTTERTASFRLQDNTPSDENQHRPRTILMNYTAGTGTNTDSALLVLQVQNRPTANSETYESNNIGTISIPFADLIGSDEYDDSELTVTFQVRDQSNLGAVSMSTSDASPSTSGGTTTYTVTSADRSVDFRSTSSADRTVTLDYEVRDPDGNAPLQESGATSRSVMINLISPPDAGAVDPQTSLRGPSIQRADVGEPITVDFDSLVSDPNQVNSALTVTFRFQDGLTAAANDLTITGATAVDETASPVIYSIDNTQNPDKEVVFTPVPDTRTNAVVVYTVTDPDMNTASSTVTLQSTAGPAPRGEPIDRVVRVVDHPDTFVIDFGDLISDSDTPISGQMITISFGAGHGFEVVEGADFDSDTATFDVTDADRRVTFRNTDPEIRIVTGTYDVTDGETPHRDRPIRIEVSGEAPICSSSQFGTLDFGTISTTGTSGERVVAITNDGNEPNTITLTAYRWLDGVGALQMQSGQTRYSTSSSNYDSKTVIPAIGARIFGLDPGETKEVYLQIRADLVNADFGGVLSQRIGISQTCGTIPAPQQPPTPDPDPVPERDTTNPVFTNPPTMASGVSERGEPVAVTFTIPAATDNEDSNVEVTSSHESGSLFQVGTTRVTFTATDDAGNRATHQLSVVVTQTVRLLEHFDSFAAWTESDDPSNWRITALNDENNPAQPDHPPGQPANNAVAQASACYRECVLELRNGVDITGEDPATLTLYRYVSSELDNEPNPDTNEFLSVEVSGDGGSTWTEAFKWEGEADDDDTWTLETYAIPDNLQTSDFKVRLIAFASDAAEQVLVDALELRVQAAGS